MVKDFKNYKHHNWIQYFQSNVVTKKIERKKASQDWNTAAFVSEEGDRRNHF